MIHCAARDPQPMKTNPRWVKPLREMGWPHAVRPAKRGGSIYRMRATSTPAGTLSAGITRHSEPLGLATGPLSSV